MTLQHFEKRRVEEKSEDSLMRHYGKDFFGGEMGERVQ